MSFNLMFALALLAPSPQVLDCVLETPQAISIVAGKVTGSPINFGDSFAKDAWQFNLASDGKTAEIIWPNSPMQLAGKSPLIATGPNSYAFFLVSRGPCLFTEGHCGSLVQFSEQADGSVKLLMSPVALTKMDNGQREPFNVAIAGTCGSKVASR